MHRLAARPLVCTLLAIAGTALAMAGRPAIAQPPPERWRLDPIARFGGATHALASDADGHVLYAGLGARVVALDVGDPASPAWIGESPVLGGVV